MIEFGMIEAYIQEAVEERVPALRAKRRVVDTELLEYSGSVADVEATMGGGCSIGPRGGDAWHPIKLVYLENATKFAVALLRNDAADAFHARLGDWCTVRFNGENSILVRPGLRDID